MKPPVVSEAEAQKASRRMTTWKPGWYSSTVAEVLAKLSKAGNECFELTHDVRNAAGEVRQIRDWLVGTPFALLKLKHAIEAVGASAKYLAGEEILPEDFAGASVEVRLGIERKRGFPDRNIIEDYRAASASVVQLRSAG
jgi:hypothetical protein